MIARILNALSTTFLILGGVALFAMMIHISADVVAKIAWNAPIIGTLEIVSYIYMVGCTFLPLAHVLRTRSMIVVEAFTGALSPRGLARVSTVTGLLTFIYFGALAIMGCLHAINKTMIGEIQDATYFELPVWPMRWVLAASCALAALIALHSSFEDWRLSRLTQPTDPERIRLGDHPT
jgi:TRAP-type C4-dicarboxylate transport system permease small subunit